MPFNVIGQHAQKYMRRNTVFRAVTNGPYQKVDSLHASKGLFHLRQAFIGADRIFRRQSFFTFACTDNINPVQLRFLLDRFLAPLPFEKSVSYS